MSVRASERLSLSLTAPQREWLRGEADRLGLTVSEVVRRILDERRSGGAVTAVSLVSAGGWTGTSPYGPRDVIRVVDEPGGGEEV